MEPSFNPWQVALTPDTEHTPDAGETLIKYPDTADPPSLDGAVQDSFTAPGEPVSAASPAGALGTVAGTKSMLAAGEEPCAFTAVTFAV